MAFYDRRDVYMPQEELLCLLQEEVGMNDQVATHPKMSFIEKMIKKEHLY